MNHEALQTTYIVQITRPQSEKTSSGVCEQHRRRPACASTQSDQRLCYSLSGEHSRHACSIQTFNFLAISEETCLSLGLSETPKTGFATTWAKLCHINLIEIIAVR